MDRYDDQEWEEISDKHSSVSHSTITSIRSVNNPNLYSSIYDTGDTLVTIDQWLPSCARTCLLAMYADMNARKNAVDALRPIFTYEQERIAVPVRMQDEASANLQSVLSRKLRYEEAFIDQTRAVWSDALERCEMRCRDYISSVQREIEAVKSRATLAKPNTTFYRGRLIDTLTQSRITAAIDETTVDIIDGIEREARQQLQLIRLNVRPSELQGIERVSEREVREAERGVPADALLALHTSYKTHLFNCNHNALQRLRNDCDRTWKRGLLESGPR